MADWDTTTPAEDELMDNVSPTITKHWVTLENAWNGDHEDLATDGTASTKHKKVTLKELAALAQVANAGGLMCNSAQAGDLYYIPPVGYTGSTAIRITEGGSVTGQLDAHGSVSGWTGANATIVNNKNISSITRTATASSLATLTIKMPLATFTSNNYTVSLTITGSASGQLGTITGLSKTADATYRIVTATIRFLDNGGSVGSSLITTVEFIAVEK